MTSTRQTQTAAVNGIAAFAMDRVAQVGRKAAVDEAANEMIREDSPRGRFVRDADDDQFDKICKQAERRIRTMTATR
jgi:hypothetical protein